MTLLTSWAFNAKDFNEGLGNKNGNLYEVLKKNISDVKTDIQDMKKDGKKNI